MNKIITIFLIILLAGCANIAEKPVNIIEDEQSINNGIKTQEENKTIEEETNIQEENMISSGEREKQVEDEVIEENTREDITNETAKKELFEEYYKKVDEILSNMTLEEKVGQMFLARYPVSEKVANEEIAKYYPGGYILFARDVKDENKESLNKKIQSNQNASKIKLLIAVDEEGGTVARVSAYSAFRQSKFKAPLKIYEQSGMNAVIEDSKEKSELLKSVSINMNLAPVVDLPTNKNSFMYARSMGTDSEITSEFATKIVARMNEDMMISCLKHFPGYGDNVDTHTGIAIDEREYEEFVERDFKPFLAGIEAGVPSILVNHNIINCMDKTMPASLSKKVHEVLRNELDFTGLIVTDDLAMDAVKSYVENGNAAVQAVLAGNDLIITSNLAGHFKEIITAVNNGTIDEEIIDTAVRRILMCKMKYGVI